MSRFIFLFLAICCFSPLAGQIPVGTWRDHLSWNTAEAVVIAGQKVYGSNGVGICIYDKSSRLLDKLTKINGLNDAGVTALQYAASVDVVVVGYDNGNIDLIAGNKIYNIPGLKWSNRYTNKRIHHIYVWGKYACLSCPFGIVLVDLQLRQVYDWCIIGDGGIPAEVFSVTEYNGYFYAATAHGLKKADRFAHFEQWKKVNDASGSTLIQAVSTERFL